MSEPNNGQSLPPQNGQLHSEGSLARYTGETQERTRPKNPGQYTGEVLLRTRPRTYRKIVALLADPDWSVQKISQACKVSDHTIRAVRTREDESITERKKRLTSTLVDVATLGSEQMERKISKASLRDATIATGVSIDKVLALTGATPVAQVAVILPSEAERENMRTLDARLDEIARRLALATSKVIELPPNE